MWVDSEAGLSCSRLSASVSGAPFSVSEVGAYDGARYHSTPGEKSTAEDADPLAYESGAIRRCE